MGFLEKLGVQEGFFGGFSMQSLVFWGGIIFLFFIILLLTGVITFFFYGRKTKKLAFKNKIPIFMEINGKHYKIGLDYAKELFIPDSNVSLFFLKSHKLYLARPTRAMGKNEYWYSISPNGEWINFSLSTDPKRNTLAVTHYDHRDTRYAFINLKEIIKRNYKDKALVWWKDPVVMNIIAFVIMSIIFIGGCWFLIAKIGTLMSMLPDFLDKMEIIAEKLARVATETRTSGVVSV